MKPGKLKEWKNTGTLGSEFLSPDAVEEATRKEPKDYAPKVKTEDGVRVVAFDGQDDFLESDNIAPRMMTDNEPFTFEAFVKPARSGRDPMLLTLAERQGFGYIDGGLQVHGLRRQARDDQRHGQPRPKTGPWVHVACVYEGTRKPSHIYVDGKLVDSVYWSAFFVMPDYRMKIGDGYSGGIARMRMWRGG